jgi:hypothetical protein
LDTVRDRRLVLAAGVVLALVAGLVIAAAILLRHVGPSPVTDSPTSGLVVETGRADDVRLDPAHPLRCFVDGKSIGELPLRECADKNGVATGALDVGLDSSGSLAAANGPTSEVTPLPPEGQEAGDQATADEASATSAPAAAVPPTAAACWRYGAGGWSRSSDEVPLAACVQALYANRCEPAGAVAYGRWGAKTLRLVGGQVQVSDDNRNFRFLSAQSGACGMAASGDEG